MGSAVSAHNLTPKQEYELYVHLHEACNEKLINMGVLEAKVPLDQEIMKTDLVAIRDEIAAASSAKPKPGGRDPSAKKEASNASNGAATAAAEEEAAKQQDERGGGGGNNNSGNGKAKVKAESTTTSSSSTESKTAAAAAPTEEETEAARKLQAVRRGSQARHDLKQKKQAATKVQAVLRGSAERKRDAEADSLLEWDNGDTNDTPKVAAAATSEEVRTCSRIAIAPRVPLFWSWLCGVVLVLVVVRRLAHRDAVTSTRRIAALPQCLLCQTLTVERWNL